MEHPEVHAPEVHTPTHLQARVSGEHRNSPIFVPVMRGPVKLVRRGTRHRRRMFMAVGALVLLVLGAFAYAFVVEQSRERTLRAETP